jgi:hypothetical protein
VPLERSNQQMFGIFNQPVEKAAQPKCFTQHTVLAEARSALIGNRILYDTLEVFA